MAILPTLGNSAMVPKVRQAMGARNQGMNPYNRMKVADGGEVHHDKVDSDRRHWVHDEVPECRKSGGKLTAHERQSMPKSEFALPGKGSGPKGAGAGSYPIPDASHARNALARVSQHGSSSEKAKVRAAVHRKYPGIGQK